MLILQIFILFIPAQLAKDHAVKLAVDSQPENVSSWHGVVDSWAVQKIQVECAKAMLLKTIMSDPDFGV